MSEKWIEITEEPETAIKINHRNLSWITCNNDQCGIHRSFKKTFNGIRFFFGGGETKYVKQILPNKNTSHGGNDDQYWEVKSPSINHTGHGKYDIDIIREPNQKIFGR